MMRSLLCLLALLPLVLGNLSSRYAFSSTLYDRDGDTYVLHWNFSTAERTIAFAVNVSTTGWVGFGLSPNGGMVNSDVVMGWVSNGRTYFHDRFAFQQALPPIDPSQDWFLVRGEEDSGYTILEFTRNWTTCDDRDRDIVANTARLIFSWNDNDPAMRDGSDAMQHTTRGTASVNLLGGLPDPPPEPRDSETFFIGVNSVEIPGDRDTTYWCVARQIPQDVLNQQHYIYMYGPSITSNNTAFVHHIIVYLCGALVNITDGTSSECMGQASLAPISQCRQGTTIAGWAVGGEDFLYPPGVAYPIGGPGASQFALIEMHYDNPSLTSGVYDSSGIVFSYTATRPENIAGILTVGSTVNYQLLIPPNANNYTVSALCSADCTQRHIPATGFKVFGNFFHTHLVGHGLTVQHFRMNPECGRLEELPPIDQNLQYDFDFQQTVHLPTERTVLPGDILLLSCFYNTATARRTQVTLGGEGTREEMCFAFLNYYPRVGTDLVACGSVPNPASFTRFVANDIPPGAAQNAVGGVLQRYGQPGLTNQEYMDAFNQIQWTQQQVNNLENDLLNGNAFTYCISRDGQFAVGDGSDPARPNAQCPYEAPNNCSDPPTVPLPCCDRPLPTTVGTASGAMVVSSLLLLAAMSLATLLM